MISLCCSPLERETEFVGECRRSSEMAAAPGSFYAVSIDATWIHYRMIPMTFKNIRGASVNYGLFYPFVKSGERHLFWKPQAHNNILQNRHWIDRFCLTKEYDSLPDLSWIVLQEIFSIHNYVSLRRPQKATNKSGLATTVSTCHGYELTRLDFQVYNIKRRGWVLR